MNYSYDDRTQLSTHFNVQEFKCKCGENHNILIENDLIDKLELLFDKLDCSKIIVNSGYRCSTHDKNVGGNGIGQHTKGTAADIVCYNQNGEIISSKFVSCAAQDIGFMGIANIDDGYTATHVDVRTNGYWFGDEVYGTGNITNNFYDYFGFSDVIKGIDVSKHQGNIDWSKVHVDFAILRAGYGKELSQKDEQFEENYAGCKKNNIPCGVYWYSYATSVEDAKKEAKVCLEVIKGKTFEFPIFFDLEEKRQFDLGKKACSEMVQAFCDTLENAGYYAGLYCSTYYLTNFVTEAVRNRYAIWVAQYNDKCTYSGQYGIWQKSSEGKINGINGNVDIDECYIDYESIIKKKGLNGFSSDTKNSDTSDTKNSDTVNKILDDIKNVYEKYR